LSSEQNAKLKSLRFYQVDKLDTTQAAQLLSRFAALEKRISQAETEEVADNNETEAGNFNCNHKALKQPKHQ
jgi:hypothetical protein